MTSCAPFGLHAGDTDWKLSANVVDNHVCNALLGSKAEKVMMVKTVNMMMAIGSNNDMN